MSGKQGLRLVEPFPSLGLKLAELRCTLARIADDHAPAVFTSSFGAEDMVLFDIIARDFREIEIVTLDTGRLPKLSPLAEWTEQDVFSYIRSHNVPYNALHDRGYPSIGCAPCTRAVAPGEDIRAGRWWWESSESKEYGLHPQRIKA